MTVTNVYAGTSDGYITSLHTSYATARTGSSLSADTSTTDSGLFVANVLSGGTTYYVAEAFVQFDLSGLAGQVVTAVSLQLWLDLAQNMGPYDVEVRSYDWGPSLTTADWVPGENLAALPLLATIAVATIGAGGAYKSFTENGTALRDAVQAAIDTATPLRLVLCHSKTTAGTTPTGVSDRAFFTAADYTGTSRDPRLVVTHEPSNTAPTISPVTADDTTFNSGSVTLVAEVTDPDAADDLTTTFEVYDDAPSLVDTETDTYTTGPADEETQQGVFAGLPDGEYTWRARVTDGTATSEWTATRSFTVVTPTTLAAELTLQAQDLLVNIDPISDELLASDPATLTAQDVELELTTIDRITETHALVFTAQDATIGKTFFFDDLPDPVTLTPHDLDASLAVLTPVFDAPALVNLTAQDLVAEIEALAFEIEPAPLLTLTAHDAELSQLSTPPSLPLVVSAHDLSAVLADLGIDVEHATLTLNAQDFGSISLTYNDITIEVGTLERLFTIDPLE